jgi:hypothetical protein
MPGQHDYRVTEVEKRARKLMRIANGRWVRMGELMDEVNARQPETVIQALTVLRRDGYVVRKRGDDEETREYRVFVVACKECAEQPGAFHKATCSLAGTEVRAGRHTREW